MPLQVDFIYFINPLQHYPFLFRCAVVFYVQTVVLSPMFGIFDMYSDVHVYYCTQGLYNHHERVCTQNWQGEKFIAPGNWACITIALPAELSHPCERQSVLFTPTRFVWPCRSCHHVWRTGSKDPYCSSPPQLTKFSCFKPQPLRRWAHPCPRPPAPSRTGCARSSTTQTWRRRMTLKLSTTPDPAREVRYITQLPSL